MFKYIFSLSPSITSILVGIFLQKMSTFMTLPFIAIFLANNTNLSPTKIGIIIGTAPLAGICSSFIGGYLSDKLGRKNILLLTVFTSTLILFSFFLATQIANMEIKIFTFTILCVFSGISSGVYEPVATAFLSDLAPPSLKGVIFQLRYFSLNFGAAIGPMIGLLLNSNGVGISFLYAGFLYIIYFSVFFILMKKNIHSVPTFSGKRHSFKESCSIIVHDKKMLYLILSCILIIFCYNQITTTFPQIMNQEVKNGIEYYSYFLTTNGILVILLQGSLYRVTRKIGLLKSLILGSALLAVGFLSLTINLNSIFILILSVILITSGEILVFPISNELIDTFAPPHMRGAYFGAASFKNLGSVLGPIWGGFLLTHLGSSFLFVSIAIISLIAPFICIAGQKEKGLSKLRV
ncbi:MDR family MFS transporter [Fluviispira multicolorata]|nr:MFS transporter [Fluviispira multicolorata]